MHKLSASDRSALIKLAASLPAGSSERRAILSGMKTAGPYGEIVQVGDRVDIKTRKGWKPGTVVEVNSNFRAKKPWYIAFTTDDAEDLKGQFSSNEYEVLRSVVSYVGRAKSTKAIQESKARGKEREDAASARADSNRDVLHNMDLKAGDVILYKYSNATRKEIVTGVNYQTGKVGIDVFQGDEGLRGRYMRNLDDKKSRQEMLEYHYGLRARKPSDRSTRWLPASGIEAVVFRAPN
jgi:hypothetical protein